MPEDTDSIDRALDDCLLHAAAEGISLGDMLACLGRSSFCFAALLLAVPFVQPFSLGPLTIISGVTFMAVGWQMGMGRSRPVLPPTAMRLHIHGKGWAGALRLCKHILGLCRRFTRPRFEGWVSGDRGDRFVGWLILTGGALLAIPAANLPFNNTLPALMIVFACIGWLERDGLMVIVSLAWGVATLVYFAAVVAALYFFGSQVCSWAGGFGFFK